MNIDRRKAVDAIYYRAERDLGFSPRIVFLSVVGSHAYNLVRENTSDIDMIGAYLAPKQYYIGLKKTEHWDPKDPIPASDPYYPDMDVKLYEIRNFFRLLLKSNPNLLETFFLQEEHYIVRSEAMYSILGMRQDVVSKKAYDHFAGYARGQLRKIEEGGTSRNMGAKRKRLVETFGYDTKNASHLIRLLKEAKVLMSTGFMDVYREDDRDELLGIINGELSLQEVKEYAEELYEEARQAHENSPLQETPNTRRVEEVLMYLLGKHLGVPGIRK